MKGAMLFATMQAVKRYTMAIEEEQAILGSVAEMLMAVYAADSVVARALQHGEEGPHAAFFDDCATGLLRTGPGSDVLLGALGALQLAEGGQARRSSAAAGAPRPLAAAGPARNPRPDCGGCDRRRRLAGQIGRQEKRLELSRPSKISTTRSAGWFDEGRDLDLGRAPTECAIMTEGASHLCENA